MKFEYELPSTSLSCQQSFHKTHPSPALPSDLRASPWVFPYSESALCLDSRLASTSLRALPSTSQRLPVSLLSFYWFLPLGLGQPTPVFSLGYPRNRGGWRATGHGVAKRYDLVSEQLQYLGSVNTLEKYIKPDSFPLCCVSLRTSSSLSSSLLSALKDSSALFSPPPDPSLSQPSARQPLFPLQGFRKRYWDLWTAQSSGSFFHLPQLHHLLICQWNSVLLTSVARLFLILLIFSAIFFWGGALFLGFFFIYLSSHQWFSIGG